MTTATLRALALLPMLLLVSLSTSLNTFAQSSDTQPSETEAEKYLAAKKVLLGQMLFFDVNISQNRTQSCSTCHSPERAFVDPRGEGAAAAASLGDNGTSLGDRMAPTAGYAAFIPMFHKNRKGFYVGGQFWDGRANTLAEQAAGPPLNPNEMGMKDEAAVVERLKENSFYKQAFPEVFGKDILEQPKKAYLAMAESIAEFEKTKAFSPFDSKYDRYLRGEYKMTDMEELGRTLFFSQQFTNCNMCHQLQKAPGRQEETFSNYEYHNIGVPENKALRAINGAKGPDYGLYNNPNVDAAKEKGKFKTPTLRNVAVTAPYMHNGVFKDLRTVVLFYNKYNSKSKKRQINPETGERWAEPEVPENIAWKELQSGPALKDQRIDALVAFMKTLTDKRFEHLLEEPAEDKSAQLKKAATKTAIKATKQAAQEKQLDKKVGAL